MSRVTVTNPYDLLTDENEDRTNVPAPKKEQKPVAAPAKPAAKPAATGAAKAAPKTEAKAPAKTDAKAAPKPAGGNSANNTVKPAPVRDSNQNLQERSKESLPPRDKRDYRAPHPAGEKKRTFDRKSGTGRIAGEVKKGGQGKGNWGNEIDAKESVEALKDEKEKVAVEGEEVDETKEEKVTVEGEKKEGDAKDETPAAPVEAEVFTLDEYLAKQKGKTITGVEAFKPRTVNADEFGAAGLVPLQREEQGSAPLQAKDKKKAVEKTAEKPAAAAAASGDKKEKSENLASQLLRFASHSEQRRGDKPYRNYDNNRRDNRAPRQNNRGPRRDNNNAAQDSKPPVQEKDFPTLSTKA